MAAGGGEVRSAPVVSDLAAHLSRAAEAVDTLFARAKARVAAKLMPGGKLDAATLDREQHMAHGLAWAATYQASIREITSFAGRLIQTSPGTGLGRGGPLTKRSGWAA